ncbi:hypothetical protein ACA910_010272 [Epithemia clementina (nom. ined.)]
MKWDSLFHHWETDKTQARQRKVDLRDIASSSVLGASSDTAGRDVFNTFTFGSSTVTLLRSVESSDSSVVNYESSSSVFTNQESFEFELLFGTGLLIGPVGSARFEYTSTTESFDVTTEELVRTRSVEATFEEPNVGDKLCIEVFE